MTSVFADTAFWNAILVERDQYHEHATKWSLTLSGQIVTTVAVLLETANALASLANRMAAISLIDHLYERPDVTIVPMSDELWVRGRELYRQRSDKAWSITDGMSFVIMEGFRMNDALTSDNHFKQAGFRPLLLESP